MTTTRVGAEGIRIQDGENALPADTADALARAVVRVPLEPELVVHLASGGWRTVESHYRWP